MKWPTKDISIPLKPLVFEKRVDLVSSSPKLIDSLLSLTHWHNDENLYLKQFVCFFNILMLVVNTGVNRYIGIRSVFRT